MSLLKRPSTQVVMALLVAVGFCAALAGVFLLAGLPWTLVVGGAVLAAFGLLVDV